MAVQTPLCQRARDGYPPYGVAKPVPPVMVGLSVAVGRFFEALFWAMMQAAGQIGAIVRAGLFVLAVVVRLVLGRWPWRRRP